MAYTSSGNEQSKSPMLIKLGIAAVALAGAGFFAFRENPDGRQPDSPDSAVAYVCRACGHGMMLTPADFDQMLKAGAMGSMESGDGERRSRAALRCPQCQKMAVVRGERCPNDGEIFFPRDRNGDPAKCPKCGWRPEG